MACKCTKKQSQAKTCTERSTHFTKRSASPTFRECHAHRGVAAGICGVNHMGPPPADTLAHSSAVIRSSPEARGSKGGHKHQRSPTPGQQCERKRSRNGLQLPLGRAGVAFDWLLCRWLANAQRNSLRQKRALKDQRTSRSGRPPLLSVSAMPTEGLPQAYVGSTT